jgi:hypothetical protein
MSNDNAGITGTLVVERFDKDGELLERFEGKNLVTDVGDQLYAERGSGVGTPDLPTGMKLGTGSTAVAKTGAGAALVTYLSGSNKAFDGGFPTSTQPGGAGTARVITYKRTYAAGEATTASPITEAAIVTETISSDTTSTAAETISRILVAGISAKGASDTLTCTWTHSLLGA